MFPDRFVIDITDSINSFVDWFVIAHGDTFTRISEHALTVLMLFEGLVRKTPWWGVVITVVLIAYWGSGRWRFGLAMGASMLFIGCLGLWDQAMQTLALMLFATLSSVIIALPVGILMSRSKLLRLVVLPLLDVMQTMPSFVYLIPALMLFGLGKVPALFATLVYATPPLIRLTDIGIRLVDKNVREAADAFGVGRLFKLLHIELPLALPNILAGVNQTTMMALSMVVIASMIGARGLGEQVLLGIQRLDVGEGLEAGLAIVAMAIVMDRTTQAFGKRRQERQQSTPQ